MLKSAYDKRKYKYVELTNGLRILLVQDLEATKSACSVTLNVGHFNDTSDCHGLSHLLEHVLFLGNQSFPSPNAFHDFVSAHGGSVNASTGTEYTSYFFDVNQEQQQDALLHLRAMLSTPLFTDKMIAKELTAIDAEFSMKQKDDLRRLYQVHKETCNPAHPFSQFSVGNQHTFSPFTTKQLKEKLQRFHKHYYQPQNTSLCLISNQDLELSESCVRGLFESWSTSGQLETAGLPMLYLPENLGIQINILPLQNARRMILTFALPEQHSHFRSKPLSVLSHIMGDEGEGGLLDFYKTQNWATSLSAGGGIEGTNFKDFNINLQLTTQGLECKDEIISAFFSYINLMEREGIDAWRINETATLNQLMWDFSDQHKCVDEALHLSQAIFDYPQEYVVAGDYILDQPSEKAVLDMLGHFLPTNMRIKMINPDAKTNTTAKWYHTPYSVQPIPVDRLQQFKNNKWQTHFQLPAANDFLQTPKQRKTTPDIHFALPKKVIALPGLSLWFGQDNKFKQPKGDCFLTFDCQAANEGIRVTTAKKLWVALLNEKLNQKYYQANLAGMHFHFYPHQAGFSLHTNGFSATQLDFCTNLLTQIVLNEDFEQNFAQVKEKQFQSLSNALLNKPINRLFSRLSVLMQQHNQAPLAMADIMQKLVLQDVLETKQKLLSQFHLEAFMYGDWSIEDARQVSPALEHFRKRYTPGDKLHRGVANVTQSPILLHEVNCQDQDPAVVIYFQAPDASIKNIALTILTEQLLATPFFNHIRTDRQLGYLVGSGYIPYNQYPGIGFYIQSPHTQANILVDAIHDFLHHMLKSLPDSHFVWESLKHSVIKQLKDKDTSLSMTSQRLWMSIGNQDRDFTYNQKMTEVMLELEFSELTCYLHALVSRNGFGEMILYNGVSPNLSDAEVVNDIQSFKQNSQYL